MTEQLLSKLTWNDFTIMKHKETQVLVLLYENPEYAKEFLELLHKNEFDISLGTEGERYFIEIFFIKSELAIRIVTNKTEETHKIEKLTIDDIPYLSTGILDKSKLPTRFVLFDTHLKSIKFDLDSFLNSYH